MHKSSIKSKILALSLALALSAGLGIGLGAQAVDQAAIAQALAAQGASGGAAPTVAPAQPTVSTLVSPGAGGGATGGAGAVAGVTGAGGAAGTAGGGATPTAAATVGVARSAIEAMFSDLASGYLGTDQRLAQFGYSLFEKPTAPSLAAIGDDYTLGPGDGLVLYLWGDPVDIREVSASYTLTVDRNGFVFLQPVGQVAVVGQSLGQLKATLKSMLDRRYKRLEMNLSLATLRQFPVFVSGYAGSPGTVLATGADTLLTVLSRAGGVAKSGSLRSVTLSRGAETKTIDFYETLISGATVDLRVKEGDSIYIPAIGAVAALAGELRRPGIYELKGETSVEQALALAGGVLPSARASGLAKLSFGDAGRAVALGNLADKGFISSLVRDGDFYYLGASASLLIGQTELSGPVKYPGRYDVNNYKTLGELLGAAKVLPETNLFYGRVYRMDSSGRDKSFAFAPKDVLSGADIALAEFDRVRLYRYDDTAIDPDFDRFSDTLVISGPVKYPGFYLFREGLTLAELLADNGLTLNASRVYAEIIAKTAEGKDEYYSFSPEEILSGEEDLTLAPLDRIRFVAQGAEVAAHDFNRFPEAVSFTGQVMRPEIFALGASLKLSEVLKPDQMLLDTNLNYAEITRLKADGRNEYLTFRPRDVLNKSFDMALSARDVIRLVRTGYDLARPDFERFSAAVKVSGPVQFAGLYAWTKGMKLSGLLSLAKPALETNQVYAEIVRPLGGTAFEYLTFAPREIAAGTADVELKARDQVRLYTTVPVVGERLSAETTTAVVTPGSATVSPTATSPVSANVASGAATVAPTTTSAEGALAAAAPVGATASAAGVPTVPGANVAGAGSMGLGGIPVDSALRFFEVVSVSGTVRYVGPYARTEGLTLSKVLTKDQLLEETNLDYAELTRLKSDGAEEYIAFAPKDVLEGKYDLALRARDSIRLVAKTGYKGTKAAADLDKFVNVVQLTGQVARPEIYAFRKGMKLSEVLKAEQLLLDTNLQYAEVTRLKSDGKHEYYTFRPSDLVSGNFDFSLDARDVIRLVRTGYDLARPDFERFSAAVKVSGPVQFAGLYAWTKGMKLSGLLSLAKPALETNQVYAEIVRPLGGTAFEYLTFAPREIAAGTADVELKARDQIRLYTTVPVVGERLSAEATVNGGAQGGGAAGAAEASPVSANVASGAATVAPTTTSAEGASVAAAPVGATPSAAGVPTAPGANVAVAGSMGLGGIPADSALRFFEVVSVSGTVRYVGPYARTEGLMLSKVLTKDQLLEETNLDYAELTRLKSDGTEEYIAFAPKDVLEGKYDLALKARDSIRLVAKTGYKGTKAAADLDKFVNVVQLTGQVARPEIYAFRKGMKLSEVLKAEQLLLDTNLQYAEVTRLKSDGKHEYYTFRPSDLVSGSFDFSLDARDVIRLVRTGYDLARPDFERFSAAVKVSGPVQFAGLYAWTKGMKLSGLLSLAKPALETNQVYAEIVRPLGGTAFEYLTFAPREIVAGTADVELKARDQVRLYTTVPVVGERLSAESATSSAASAGIGGTATGEAQIGGAAGTAAAPVSANVASGAATVAPTTTSAEGALAAAAPVGATPSAAGVPTASGANVAGTASIGLGGIPADSALRFFEVVSVSGTVRYVGPYARTEGLTLSKVLTKDQLLEETNLDYAELTRLKSDGAEEYIAFAPKDVLEGKYDLALRARDSIRLVAKTGYKGTKAAADLDKFVNVVQLTGQVARPEIYAFRKGMKLSEVLKAEQLLLDTNLQYAEVTRLKSDGKHEYLTFAPFDLASGMYDLELSARDTIKMVEVGYSPAMPDFDRFSNAVKVSGPLLFSGVYAWKDGMMLSSLQKTAGLVLDTNQVYADIQRPLPGGKTQLLTFAPREVEAGILDIRLSPKDSIHYYSMAAVAEAKKKAEEAQVVQDQNLTVTVPGTSDVSTAGTTAVAPASAQAAEASSTGATASTGESQGFYVEIVNVSGPVAYEGPYARTPTLTLSSVVTVDQMLSMTNIDYAELSRRRNDGGVEYLSFSPREVLSGNFDLDLRAQDSIRYVELGYLPEKPDFDRFGNAYALMGAVRNPGLYSMSEFVPLSEVITTEQLLGVTDIYYAEIERWVPGGRTEYLTFSPVAVLLGEQDFKLLPRDVVRLIPSTNLVTDHDFARYPNTVLVSGVVRYPGRYAWYEGLSLADLISSNDILIDTSLEYAELRRRGFSTESILSFSPKALLEEDKDIALNPRDVVVFYPRYHNKPVTIAGEVKETKVIPFYEGIELATVLRSVALGKDIDRLKAIITKSTGEKQKVYLEDYYRKQNSSRVMMSPGDAVSIETLLPEENLPVITVRGAVKKPQTLEYRQGMKLLDALQAVEGYDARAYPYGLVLIRKTAAETQQKQVDRLIAQLEAASAAGAALPTGTDSSLSSAAAVVANLQIDLAVQRAKLGSLRQLYKEGFGRISLDMPNSLEALARSSSNIMLERDDLIFVPNAPSYVMVSGQVADQNVVVFRDGMTVRQALAESGWVSEDADISKAYIVRASGRLDSTEGKRGFLWFKPTILKYSLLPGDTVVIPSKAVKVSVAWSYIKDGLSVVSTILTSALTAVTLLGL